MGNGGCPAHQDKIIAEIKEVKTYLSRKIECIEKKLLEPDDGLYARTGKNTKFRKDAEGLIPEIADNTRFRKSSKRWLSIISVGFLGTMIKAGYDFFKDRL